MSSSRILYSFDVNLKDLEELLMRKIQESNTTLQNTQENVNGLGQSKGIPADQNTPSGAVQKEMVCLSGIEENKATAGRFGIALFSLFVF